MAVVWLPGRRAGLEAVEKVSQRRTSADTTERDAAMLLLHPRLARVDLAG